MGIGGICDLRLRQTDGTGRRSRLKPHIFQQICLVVGFVQGEGPNEDFDLGGEKCTSNKRVVECSVGVRSLQQLVNGPCFQISVS